MRANAELEALLALAPRDRENIRWAADWRRLMPGEDPDTTDQDEIERWICSYNELIGHNLELIAGIRAHLRQGAGEGDAGYDQRADLVLLQAHLIRLRRRRLFWQQRRRLHRRARAAAGRAPLGSVWLAERPEGVLSPSEYVTG